MVWSFQDFIFCLHGTWLSWLTWEFVAQYSLFQFCLCISFEFADRYNTALVCHRWRYLACHPRLWLRVDRFVKDLSQPGVFHNIESAVSAARFVIIISYVVHIFVIRRRVHKPDQIVTSRPGDTILIGAGGNHRVSNIQIKKPLCLVCLWMIICLVWWLDISWRFLHFHDMSLSFP